MSESAYPDRDGSVFFDLARDRLNVQLGTLDALDTKVAVLFSTSTTLLGILAAVLALKTSKLSGWDVAGVAASTLAYLLVAWLGWKAYRLREWKVGPELRSVWKTYSESGESDKTLQWAVGNKLRIHYEQNKANAQEKIDALGLIAPIVFIQSLILVLTLFRVA